MNATLKHRKRSIVTYLAETQDEAVILQIENLLKPAVDIWDELTESQKATIRLGVQQLKEGKKIEWCRFKDAMSTSPTRAVILNEVKNLG